MSWWVIMIEMVAFAALFTAIVFCYYRGDRKYSPASIHNYPPDIQEEYFKTHERVDVSYRSKSVLLTKGLGVLIFALILLGCALIAGARSFWQEFLLAFGLMAWIGVYDTCFLDWVLFANLPMFRLEGTEHMDKALSPEVVSREGNAVSGGHFRACSRRNSRTTGHVDQMKGYDFAKMMTKNFERITVSDIDAICHACCHYDLRKLTEEEQRKLHLDFGEKDFDWMYSKKAIPVYMPNADLKIRPGYAHCGYMAAETEKYVREIEAFIF